MNKNGFDVAARTNCVVDWLSMMKDADRVDSQPVHRDAYWIKICSIATFKVLMIVEI